MANATPVHSKPKAKKPLSKDAEAIKKELAELETNAGDNVDVPTVGPSTRTLEDGTVREDL